MSAEKQTFQEIEKRKEKLSRKELVRRIASTALFGTAVVTGTIAAVDHLDYGDAKQAAVELEAQNDPRAEEWHELAAENETNRNYAGIATMGEVSLALLASSSADRMRARRKQLDGPEDDSSAVDKKD